HAPIVSGTASPSSARAASPTSSREYKNRRVPKGYKPRQDLYGSWIAKKPSKADKFSFDFWVESVEELKIILRGDKECEIDGKSLHSCALNICKICVALCGGNEQHGGSAEEEKVVFDSDLIVSNPYSHFLMPIGHWIVKRAAKCGIVDHFLPHRLIGPLWGVVSWFLMEREGVHVSHLVLESAYETLDRKFRREKESIIRAKEGVSKPLEDHESCMMVEVDVDLEDVVIARKKIRVSRKL
ncbi:hypothetical protein ADUPG1_000302, partial [Aduncisulcus paluster]